MVRHTECPYGTRLHTGSVLIWYDMILIGTANLGIKWYCPIAWDKGMIKSNPKPRHITLVFGYNVLQDSGKTHQIFGYNNVLASYVTTLHLFFFNFLKTCKNKLASIWKKWGAHIGGGFYFGSLDSCP